LPVLPLVVFDAVIDNAVTSKAISCLYNAIKGKVKMSKFTSRTKEVQKGGAMAIAVFTKP